MVVVMMYIFPQQPERGTSLAHYVAMLLMPALWSRHESARRHDGEGHATRFCPHRLIRSGAYAQQRSSPARSYVCAVNGPSGAVG